MPSKSIYLNNWEDVNEIQTLDLMWFQSVRTLHARQDSNNLFSESTGARERREGVRLGGKGKRKNLSNVHRLPGQGMQKMMMKRKVATVWVYGKEGCT